MRSLLVVPLLLAVAFVPAASADCALVLCTEESSYGEGSCDAPGEYSGSTTTITAGDASVTGTAYCYNDWEVGQGSGSAIVVNAAGTSVMWGEFNGSCYVFVYRGEGVSVLPCATPPPNPGWGGVLP